MYGTSRCLEHSMNKETRMTDNNPKSDPAPNTNTVKDPDDWTTGDEPMTGAQASYLKTLSEQTKTEYHDGLSKAEASKRIDGLRGKAGLA